MDLFEYGGQTYLTTVNNFSRLIEIKSLKTHTEVSVITASKELYETSRRIARPPDRLDL